MGLGIPGLDTLLEIPRMMFAEEQQNDAQEFSLGSQQISQDFNSAQAVLNRQFQERMRATQYQTAVADMQAAGLNPALAYQQGGAGTPVGALARGTSTSSGIATPATGHPAMASLQSASAIEVNDAQAAKLQAEAKEIEARTKTYPVSIEVMNQQIRESVEKIHTMLTQQNFYTATANQAAQQVENLRETVPQIRATVDNLKAITKQTGALTGKTTEETAEIKQRVSAALPQIQAALQELEAQARSLDMPRREQDRAAHDRFTGAMGALIRSLTGLGTYIR